MTIFAQRFNICSSKFEREYGAFRPLVRLMFFLHISSPMSKYVKRYLTVD